MFARLDMSMFDLYSIQQKIVDVLLAGQLKSSGNLVGNKLI
jgi:hypothetical protein